MNRKKNKCTEIMRLLWTQGHTLSQNHTEFGMYIVYIISYSSKLFFVTAQQLDSCKRTDLETLFCKHATGHSCDLSTFVQWWSQLHLILVKVLSYKFLFFFTHTKTYIEKTTKWMRQIVIADKCFQPHTNYRTHTQERNSDIHAHIKCTSKLNPIL